MDNSVKEKMRRVRCVVDAANLRALANLIEVTGEPLSKKEEIDYEQKRQEQYLFDDAVAWEIHRRVNDARRREELSDDPPTMLEVCTHQGKSWEVVGKEIFCNECDCFVVQKNEQWVKNVNRNFKVISKPESISRRLAHTKPLDCPDCEATGITPHGDICGRCKGLGGIDPLMKPGL